MIRWLILVSVIFLCQMSCIGRLTSLSKNNDKGSVVNTINQSTSNVSQDELSGKDHYYKANSLAKNGKPDEALKEYDRAIEKQYDTVDLRIQMGTVLAKQLNRHEEAAMQFRIAIQREGTSWRAHWLLSQSLLELKYYNEALNEILTSETLDPEGKSEGFYDYFKAKAFDGLGKYDKAVRAYESFLQHAAKITPNSPKILEAQLRLKQLQEQKN